MCQLLLDIPTLDPTTRWLLVIAVGLTIFYAVLRPMRKKKDPLDKPSNWRSLSSQRAVERDMNNLLVELSEMARQITAQLDTRTLKLEMLLKQADERIATLKAVAPAVAISNGNRTTNDETTILPMRQAPVVDPRHQEIYEFADEGLSSQQIAGRLGRPRGEIDLILALREKNENKSERSQQTQGAISARESVGSALADAENALSRG